MTAEKVVKCVRQTNEKLSLSEAPSRYQSIQSQYHYNSTMSKSWEENKMASEVCRSQGEIKMKTVRS